MRRGPLGRQLCRLCRGYEPTQRARGMRGTRRKSGQSAQRGDSDCGALTLANSFSARRLAAILSLRETISSPDTRTERHEATSRNVATSSLLVVRGKPLACHTRSSSSVLRRTEATRGMDAIDRGHDVPALGRGAGK
jgi:hypothetical protein